MNKRILDWWFFLPAVNATVFRWYLDSITIEKLGKQLLLLNWFFTMYIKPNVYIQASTFPHSGVQEILTWINLVLIDNHLV